VNVPLKFCHQVLGLDHLHYGLWDDDPLTLEGLKVAQRRYTDFLLERFPENARSLLDVGAGTGATGRLLRDLGLQVDGLSPDPYQKELFEARVERPFHLGRFQEFYPEIPYDMVLMSESSQYIWLDSLFPAVCRCAAGGYLLVADYFVVEADGSPLAKSGHPLDAYLQKAEENGLELELQDDITQAAIPTLDLGRLWIDRYINPSLDLLDESLARRYPRLFGLGRRLLKSQLDKLQNARQLMDSEGFGRVKRYQVLRFKVPA
jgi:SAM-dependent methyltransferase